MPVLIIIFGLLLMLFGGGCVTVLAPFILHGPGPSTLNSWWGWLPMLVVLGIPPILSGSMTLWSFARRGKFSRPAFLRWLVALDVASVVAVFIYYLATSFIYRNFWNFAAVYGILIFLFLGKAWLIRHSVRTQPLQGGS